jgi:dsRNA-specific ribonuclease
MALWATTLQFLEPFQFQSFTYCLFTNMQVLGDVIESIAGTIYIDKKHNKEALWRSMKRLLEPLGFCNPS